MGWPLVQVLHWLQSSPVSPKMSIYQVFVVMTGLEPGTSTVSRWWRFQLTELRASTRLIKLPAGGRAVTSGPTLRRRSAPFPPTAAASHDAVEEIRRRPAALRARACRPPRRARHPDDTLAAAPASAWMPSTGPAPAGDLDPDGTAACSATTAALADHLGIERGAVLGWSAAMLAVRCGTSPRCSSGSASRASPRRRRPTPSRGSLSTAPATSAGGWPRPPRRCRRRRSWGRGGAADRAAPVATRRCATTAGGAGPAPAGRSWRPCPAPSRPWRPPPWTPPRRAAWPDWPTTSSSSALMHPDIDLPPSAPGAAWSGSADRSTPPASAPGSPPARRTPTSRSSTGRAPAVATR